MNKNSSLKMFMNIFVGSNEQELYDMFDKITSFIQKERKQIFFFEEQEGENVYFLTSGMVKLYKTNEEGKEAIIHFVRPGELFAEILLYLRNRYPVTAVATEDSTALVINSKKLFDIIKQKPEISMKLIGTLAQRIKYFVNMVENLTLADAQKRFLNYLRNLSAKKNSSTFTLPASKADVALLLGVAPETFSRLLKKMSDEGILKVDGKDITLL